jgi:hypothetical protein
MENVVQSPFSGQPAQLKTEHVTLPFKGQRYEVVRSYYHCEASGEDFTSPEQHDHVVRQLRTLHTERSIAADLAKNSGQIASRIAGATIGAINVAFTFDDTNAATARQSYSDWSHQANSSMELAD